MTTHYDLVVIGSGSGNTIVDRHFIDRRVAIVERGRFGGTCSNVGCIPSKMLIHPADIVETARHAARLGVDVDVRGVRWDDVRDRVFDRLDEISRSGRDYREGQPHVTLYEAEARFVGHKRLVVGDDEITADHIVIAAGARTNVPDVPGLADVHVDTSDTIMRVPELPRRLVILGGGFIAAEMGHVFEAYGSEVTVLMRGERLLSHEDPDIGHRITERLGERLRLVPQCDVTLVRQAGDSIVLEYTCPEGEHAVECDRLLVATGRTPNGDQLDVGATGVRLDDDGYVITDDTMSTGVDGIWALGDVTNPLQLKHLANLEARVVQHNILHPESPRRIDERFVPHAVFTSPQVAKVGLTEPEAERRGRPFAVAHRDYSTTAYGWALDDHTSFAKVIADQETRQLIGAHVIGPEASILIQQLVQGMRFGQTVDEMARDVIYPHPALSEVIENALLQLVRALDGTLED